MESKTVIDALSALAQEHRLRIFRLLACAGVDGMRAGVIGNELSLPRATLSFHLKEMKHAGIVECERRGRTQIYQANFEVMGGVMNYLTENCCAGVGAEERRRNHDL